MTREEAIGTEYTEEYPPDMARTNHLNGHRITWRVVEIVDCLDYNGQAVKAERVQAVKIEELDRSVK